MDKSTQGPRQMANLIVEEVFYSGTDDLYEGEAVCYDYDYGTATEYDGRRHNRVERPNLTNNRRFAGVVLSDYAGRTGGRVVKIAVPGSKGVLIALGCDVTCGQAGVLTFTAGASGSHRGRWYTGMQVGRGAARIKQTVTAVLQSSMTGGWSIATDGVTITMTTTGLAAGDTVVLLGGAIEAAGGSIVPGKYTISSVAVGSLVLTSSAITGTATGALTCTGYAYTGNPKAQADLLEGEECGGCEFISPPNAGTDAQAYMVGGKSYICGGVTLAADVEVEFAQGSYCGEMKQFVVLGTLTTNDFVIDLVTTGKKKDGSTNLLEVEDMDAAGDTWNGIFDGVIWNTFGFTGATEV